MRWSRTKSRSARWKTETQRWFKITTQRCWEKIMDNSMVPGLLPAYMPWAGCKQTPERDRGWLCSAGWDGSLHPQCQHCPCLTLIPNLWFWRGISSCSPPLPLGSSSWATLSLKVLAFSCFGDLTLTTHQPWGGTKTLGCPSRRPRFALAAPSPVLRPGGPLLGAPGNSGSPTHTAVLPQPPLQTRSHFLSSPAFTPTLFFWLA